MGSGKTPTDFMTQLTAETAGLAVHLASLTLVVPFFSFSLVSAHVRGPITVLNLMADCSILEGSPIPIKLPFLCFLP